MTEIRLNDNDNLNEENFASKAEEIMQAWKKATQNQPFNGLSTTKLRNIYAMIVNISGKIDNETDFPKNKAELQYLKVKIAYEIGREGSVRTFNKKTKLMEYIDGITTYAQFSLYCRYAESLVAYFKYYDGDKDGGKD